MTTLPNEQTPFTFQQLQGMVHDLDISQFLNDLSLSNIPTSIYTISPMIPPYTKFSQNARDTTFSPSTLCHTYTTGYNILTWKGYNDLGLGINEHGIENPINPPIQHHKSSISHVSSIENNYSIVYCLWCYTNFKYILRN